MVAWNVFGVLGLLAAVVAWTLALRIVTITPRRSINLRLATVLALEGGLMVTALGVAQIVTNESAALQWNRALGYPSMLLVPAYLWFLASFDTPLVRPLRKRGVLPGLVALAVATMAFHAARPDLFTVGVAPLGPVPWVPDYAAGAKIIGLLNTAVHLFGIAVAVSALRHASQEVVTRRRARWSLGAFLVRDLPFTLILGTFHAAGSPTVLHGQISFIAAPLVSMAFVSLLTYAILREQIFDFDLRFRRRVSQGTVAVLVVATVLLVRESVLALADSVWANLLAAATMIALFAGLARIRLVVDRAVQATMPAPADPDVRRLEVYRAALLESRRADDPYGSDALLRILRGQLGLSERDHQLMLAGLRSDGEVGALLPGQTFVGRYRVLRSLGAWSRSETFAAHDEELDRPVALKLLRPGYAVAGHAASVAPVMAETYDVVALGGRQVMVQQWMPGGSLRDQLEAGPLPNDGWWRLAEGLETALRGLREAGVVHGGLRPENLLFDAQRRVHFDVPEATGEATADVADEPSATVAYHSRSRVRGGGPSTEDDRWATACCLWEAATGKPVVPVKDDEPAAEVRLRIARGVHVDAAQVDSLPEPWRSNMLAAFDAAGPAMEVGS